MTNHHTGSISNKALHAHLPVKENRFGDLYIEALVGTTFESVSATEEFQMRFGGALFHEQTLYIIVGSDSGLLPKYIINHGLPRGSRYLFVEPYEIRNHLDEDMISAELANRITISDEAHWVEHAHELALLNYTYSGKISYVRSCAAQQNIHPDYLVLSQTLDRDLRHLFWLFTTQFDSHIFINSQLANLAENRTPAICLKECFKGKSAIILGAAPSLDGLIPWIKKHCNEVIIIAVSRISERLLQVGIEPDIVVSVDPQNVSFSVSKGMLNLGNRTLLVNGSHATPLLVGQWPNRSVFLGPRLPWHDEGFNNFSTIAPTVTNNAILLAQELGCNQIILAGVDLCYSANGYTHAQGTAERTAGAMIGKFDFIVTTNSGTAADTNKGYYEAISEICKQAQKALINGCKIINLAETAAKIEGVEYIHPEKIIITHPLTEPAFDTISSLLDKDTVEDRCSHYNATIKQIDKATKELRNIIRLATVALNCNAKMEKLLKTPDYSKYKIQMDKIERKLNLRYEVMSTVVKSYNSSGFSKIITADTGDDWTSGELFDKTKTYYDEYIHGSSVLLGHIHDSKKRLLNRLEEESPSPKFERMFIQWQQDIEFGRAMIWKERHPDIYKKSLAQINQHMNTLTNQFNSLLDTDNKNFDNAIQSHFADPNTYGKIVENAIAHHAKGDEDGLVRLSEGLLERTEELSVQTLLLVNGLISELKNNYKKAEDTYYSIDPKVSLDLKQIALERIVNFSLVKEDYKTVLPALKQLSEIRVSYRPFYARFLALAGEVVEAIEVYTQHLQYQPRDIDTLVELGMLLAAAGAREAAESILNQISEADPTHSGIDNLTQALETNLSQH